ncbi:hypothetical protein CLOM_g6357 [Closterium sp. NIES-68]|nr:hypothetical protein CLOM_g6357 [Closterium sp. NIES-68]
MHTRRLSSHRDARLRRLNSLTTVALLVRWALAVKHARALAGEAGMEHGMSLYRAWADAYGLKDHPRSPLPPPTLELPASVPPAPHLEDCAQVSFFRFMAEERGGPGGGNPPKWAVQPSCCHCSPQTPWVRGSAADSLARTREAQRDIWANQMPPGGCEDRRLLVAPWPDATRFSLASQLHSMASLLALALLHNRTLVPLPGSFQPANNEICQEYQPIGAMGGHGSMGDWGCYFFPIASPRCSADVSTAMAANRMPPCHRDASQFEQLATSADRVVCVDGSDVDQTNSAALSLVEARATKLWGRPHLEQQGHREYLGEVPPADELKEQVHWWRAQAVRFMLRWPSAHLCHVINRQRHTAYGMHAANRIASLPATRVSILQSIAASSAGPAAAQNLSLSAEASDLATLDLIPGSDSFPGSNPESEARQSSRGKDLEERVWEARGFDMCSQRCGGVGRGEYGRVGGEPLFAVRPMVGVAMGGGKEADGREGGGGGNDGAREGSGGRGVVTASVVGVHVHVMAANVLRLGDVDARHMWVSWHGGAQLPPPDSVHFPDWTLYLPSPSASPDSPSPHNLRRLLEEQAAAAPAASAGSAAPADFESATAPLAATAPSAGSTAGDGGSTGAPAEVGDVGASSAASDGWEESEQLARLVVGSQCDGFVGMHGDVWAQLLDLLRATGGRRQLRFMYINVP